MELSAILLVNWPREGLYFRGEDFFKYGVTFSKFQRFTFWYLLLVPHLIVPVSESIIFFH